MTRLRVPLEPARLPKCPALPIVRPSRAHSPRSICARAKSSGASSILSRQRRARRVAQPVARSADDVAPASIRNVMQDLEELGLIYAPHTSAGRLPTQGGLRFMSTRCWSSAASATRSARHRTAGARGRRGRLRKRADAHDDVAFRSHPWGGTGADNQRRSAPAPYRIRSRRAGEGACGAGRGGRRG